MAIKMNNHPVAAKMACLLCLLFMACHVFSENHKSAFQPPLPEPVKLSAQQDSLLNNNLELFFRDYYRYGKLSENMRTISSHYRTQFRSLFASNAMVYDFLITDLLVDVDGFIDNLVNEFPHGISFINIKKNNIDVYDYDAKTYLASVTAEMEITVHHVNDDFVSKSHNEELVLNILLDKSIDRKTFLIESIRKPIFYPIPEVAVSVINMEAPTSKMEGVELILMYEGEIIQSQASNRDGVVRFLAVPSDRQTHVRLAESMPYEEYEILVLEPLSESFKTNESVFIRPADSEPSATVDTEPTLTLDPEPAVTAEPEPAVAKDQEPTGTAEPEFAVADDPRPTRVIVRKPSSWLVGVNLAPSITSFNLVDYLLIKPYDMPDVKSRQLGFTMGLEARYRRYVNNSFSLDFGAGLQINTFGYSYEKNEISQTVVDEEYKFTDFEHKGSVLFLQVPLSVYLRHEKDWSAFDARYAYLRLNLSNAIGKSFSQFGHDDSNDKLGRNGDLFITGILPSLEFGAGVELNTRITELVFSAGLGCTFYLGDMVNVPSNWEKRVINDIITERGGSPIFHYATNSRLFQWGPSFSIIYQISD